MAGPGQVHVIEKLAARFLARLTALVGLKTEALAKRHPPAPRKTGDLISEIGFRRVSDFRGEVVAGTGFSRAYAGVQERRFGYMRRAARGRASDNRQPGR